MFFKCRLVTIPQAAPLLASVAFQTSERLVPKTSNEVSNKLYLIPKKAKKKKEKSVRRRGKLKFTTKGHNLSTLEERRLMKIYLLAAAILFFSECPSMSMSASSIFDVCKLKHWMH